MNTVTATDLVNASKYNKVLFKGPEKIRLGLGWCSCFVIAYHKMGFCSIL